MSIIAFFSPRRPSRLRAAVSDRLAGARVAVLNRRLSRLSPTFVGQGPMQVSEPAAVELPDVEVIESAAAEFARAAEQARTADRGKRKARKILDRIPAGVYGRWTVTREASNRMTADLDAIRAIFKAHNLGAVPMKSSGPSLKVTRVTPEIPLPSAAELLAQVSR